MTDAQLWAAWQFWLIVAVVIVLVAATLLVIILLTARKILSEAVRALHAAERIRANTEPIWALQTTNEVAEQLLATVHRIAEAGGGVAGALEDHQHAGGRRAE